MTVSSKLFLVSCVKRKCAEARPAADLYTSDWFRKARAFVERESRPGDEWRILSAEYGLLMPDTRVEPYERTLNAMRGEERERWAERVLGQLDLMTPRPVVILAGENYRRYLTGPLAARGWQVSIPMVGLGIGRQLRWLKEAA